jgi:hypothetical protein
VTDVERLGRMCDDAASSDAGLLWGAFAHNLTVAARDLYFEDRAEVLRAKSRVLNEVLHRVTAELRSLASTHKPEFGRGDLTRIVLDLSANSAASELVQWAARTTLKPWLGPSDPTPV